MRLCHGFNRALATTVFCLAMVAGVVPSVSAATATPMPRDFHVLAKTAASAKVTWRNPARVRYVVVSVNGHTTKVVGSAATVPARLGDSIRLRAVYPGKATSPWSRTIRKPRTAAEKSAAAAQIDELEAARAAADDRRWDHLADLASAADSYAAEVYQLRIDIEGRTIDNLDLELARVRSAYNAYPTGAATTIAVNNLENDIAALQIQQWQLRRSRAGLMQQIADLRAAGAGSEILGLYLDQVAQIDAKLTDFDSQVAELEEQLAGLAGPAH